MLDLNPYQPRTDYPGHFIRNLGRSLKDDGVIQPILVRPKGDRYEVCTGWMRVLAAREVGISSIPAIVKDLTDEQMARLCLVENLKRKDLNILEKARGYKQMQDTWHLTQEQVAEELGLTRDQVAQALRVLTFPQEVQKLVSDDTITQTHAEALARLHDRPAALAEAIDKVVKGNLTTTQTEGLVRDLMERETLSREIVEYVLSEDFILTLDYLLPRGQDDLIQCPLCGSTELEGDTEFGFGKTCKRCKWSDGRATDRLWNLQRRIRHRVLKQRGLKPN